MLRFMGFPPNTEAKGDIDSMDLLAGQSVGILKRVALALFARADVVVAAAAV